MIGVNSPGCQFLSGSQQLQELCVPLSPAALPVVAGSTQLTWLQCDWRQQQQQPAGRAGALLLCPSVRALVTEAGAVPFEAFPGLAELVQGGSWQPSAFTSLAQHCSGLQQLHISSHFDTSVPSMPLHTPAADCARAVRSLSALQQLTWLSFAPYGRPEVAALTALQQLRGLMLRIPTRSALRLSAFDQLGALSSLTQLAIELPGSREFSGKQLQHLLASVQQVRSVRLYVDAGRVPAAEVVVREARQANAAAGAGGPADVRVADMNPGVDYDA
ncbi:hypothetical protein OEZ85_002808 [Tetradesmus obliquus]|uniref:Uncharacterized protein n=1 Tax=Tetradesmus obliquus TaxID=3088 RepID=A0ABY8TYP5_TETOB|nr:hypothetical protein OEZ85_002808 [Tetradesmus obliquus]